jgi:hypothetical protein
MQGAATLIFSGPKGETHRTDNRSSSGTIPVCSIVDHAGVEKRAQSNRLVVLHPGEREQQLGVADQLSCCRRADRRWNPWADGIGLEAAHRRDPAAK